METNFNATILAQAISELLGGNLHYSRKVGGGKLNSNRLASSYANTNAGVDCSGFVRFVLSRGSGGALELIGGSAAQAEYLDKRGYRKISTQDADVETARCDDVVRVGVRDTVRERDAAGKPVPGLNTKGQLKKKQVGHIWIMINGITYQSSSRQHGIGPIASSWSNRRGDGNQFFQVGPAPGFGALTLGGMKVSPQMAAAFLE